ncbi:hypothetical protein SBOR_9781 [Sclerotinia borealis F-4128]|uniref:UBA domain-containing protein n=1 Tax=Sclerotinia borealis (strain F-4128) TaxID=1432307 RepID=W9BZ53_SCLBF|nr:hypothetical protein SBOR_9781 [Sclerotinia borealis F-4128]
MATLSTPVPPLINQHAPLLKPKLSEIIVHLPFIPWSIPSESKLQHLFDKLIDRIQNARSIDGTIKESISNSLNIVPRVHRPPSWKFINIELVFEDSKDIHAIHERFKEIIKDFAHSLEYLQSCPVYVSNAQSIPDGGSHVRGVVDRDELLHCIPRPYMLNWRPPPQLESAEARSPNANQCIKTKAGIAQLLTISLGPSDVKLREGSQICNSDMTPDVSSRTHGPSPALSDLQLDFTELSKEFYKQAISTVNSNKAVPAEMTNSNYISDNSSEADHMTLNLESTHSELVQKWVEQLRRQDTGLRETLHPYSLKEDNSGSMVEWPWVQTELHGAGTRSSILKASPESDIKDSLVSRPSVSDIAGGNSGSNTDRSTLFSIEPPCADLSKAWRQYLLDSKSSPSCIRGIITEADIEQSASPVLDSASTHLRGGCAVGWKFYGQRAKKITKRSQQQHHCQYDIDLGYGGSHLFAQTFPDYDPTVDLMYMCEANERYRVDAHITSKRAENERDIICEALSMRQESIEWSEVSSNSIRSIRSNSSSAHSDPRPGPESTRMHLRGGETYVDTDVLSNAPSVSSGRSYKRESYCSTGKAFIKFLREKVIGKKQTQNERKKENNEHEAFTSNAHDRFYRFERQVAALEAELRQIEKTFPKNSAIVGESSDISKKTERIRALVLRLEGIQKRLMYFDCKKAGRTREVLQNRNNLARTAQSNIPVIDRGGGGLQCARYRCCRTVNKFCKSITDRKKPQNEGNGQTTIKEEDKENEHQRSGKLTVRDDDIPLPLKRLFEEYNQLGEDIFALKVELQQIERTLAEKHVVMEDRGCPQDIEDTERLRAFELIVEEIRNRNEDSVKLIHDGQRRAERAKAILERKIRHAQDADFKSSALPRCRDNQRPVESVKPFKPIKPIKPGQPGRPPARSVKENVSSSDDTIKNILSQYDQVLEDLEHLRVMGRSLAESGVRVEPYPSFWTTFRELHATEKLKKEIQNLRDQGLTPSITLANDGLSRAKKAKILVEENVNMARAVYFNSKASLTQQRGGAGSGRKCERIRRKLDKFTSFVRKMVDGHTDHDWTRDQSIDKPIDTLLIDYDQLAWEIQELRDIEDALEENGAKAWKGEDYLNDVELLREYDETRQEMQLLREHGSPSIRHVRIGVSRAECAKIIMEEWNNALRASLPAVDPVVKSKFKQVFGRLRGGGLECIGDRSGCNFVQVAPHLRGGYTVEATNTKRHFASVRCTKRVLMKELDITLNSQSESTDTRLRGGGFKGLDSLRNTFANTGNKLRNSVEQSGLGRRRGDSAIGGLSSTSSRQTNESGQNTPPPTGIRVSVYEIIPLEDIAEAAEVAEVAAHTTSEEFEDPAETKERERKEGEEMTRRQLERKQELLDIPNDFATISDGFHELEKYIGRKHKVICHEPVAKRDFEAKVTEDESKHIKEFKQAKWEITGLEYESIRGVLSPIQITLAKNYLIAARRTKEIFENWCDKKAASRKQMQWSNSAAEGTEKILDEWHYGVVSQNHTSSQEERDSFLRRERSMVLESIRIKSAQKKSEERGESSKNSAPIPIQQKGKELGESSESSAPDPVQQYQGEELDCFSKSNAPDPVQQYQGEELGFLTKSIAPDPVQQYQGEELGFLTNSCAPDPVQELMEQTDRLRMDNLLFEDRTPPARRKKSDFKKLKYLNLTNINEEIEEQAMLSKDKIVELEILGASHDEAIKALTAAKGDVSYAATLFLVPGDPEDEEMGPLPRFPLEDIHQLITCGATGSQAVKSLAASGGDVSEAAELLFPLIPPGQKTRDDVWGAAKPLVPLVSPRKETRDDISVNDGYDNRNGMTDRKGKGKAL